jgi:hypothetical protein
VVYRSLAAVGGILLALALAGPALAVRAHVRVESAHATIWGATEPLVRPVHGTFRPPDGPKVTVSGPTALGALERASRRGEFYYRVQATSFGPYVDRIGRRAAKGSSGWTFKVNHVLAPVGADAMTLKRGDHLLWYWATFGPNGGPKTLDVKRVGGGCFRAFAYDDNGARSRPKNVIFRVNGHDRDSASGRICPSPRWETLRARKRGMVRSAVLVH